MKFFVFVLTACAFGIEPIKTQEFCYKNPKCGQESELWGGACKTGRAQSPINIQADWSLTQSAAIVFNSAYKAGVDSAFVINNGHSVQVSAAPDATSRMTFMTSLFPNDVYVFGQAHCHWKSEHTFDNEYYPLECHLVHYNSKYGSIGEAVASGTQGALAIFGILYKAHPIIGNSPLRVFTANMDKILRPTEGQAIPVASSFNVLEMLRPDPSVAVGSIIEAFQYEGSLTTPQCNEGMHWFVLRNPQYISQYQLDLFNQVFGRENQLMSNNRRDLQPANGRVPLQVKLMIQ